MPSGGPHRRRRRWERGRRVSSLSASPGGPSCAGRRWWECGESGKEGRRGTLCWQAGTLRSGRERAGTVADMPCPWAPIRQLGDAARIKEGLFKVKHMI